MLQAELLSRANEAREAGHLPEAIALYRQVVRAEPSNAEAWWYLGLSHYDRDEHAGCAQAFGKVAALDLKNGPAHVFAGLCQFQLKQYESALAHIIEGKRLGVPAKTELDRVAHYHYVQLLGKVGQFEAATGLLADLARALPDTPKLVELAGLNSLRIAALPEELTAEQREPVELAGKAAVLAWQRRVPEAHKLAAELLGKYPKLAGVHYFVGWLHILDHSDLAFVEFEKEIARDPKHVQARLQIAYEYLQRGEGAKGLPYAREAAAIAPSDFTARNIHGRILLEGGKIRAAVQELEAAVKLAPTSPEAHFHLAAAYARSGRKTEADKHRKIFAELDKARKGEQ